MMLDIPHEAASQKKIESIAIKMILRKIPAAANFEGLIKFVHDGKKVALDLTLLPLDHAVEIEKMLD